MTAPRQLALDLPPLTSFSREDFLVSPSNEAAYAFIERWPDWPARRTLLIGPRGSGKSHLAAIWSDMAGAITMPAGMLAEASVPGLVARKAVVIEDAGAGIDERALFHLLNLIGETGSSLLVTANQPPDRWSLSLPDLVSRLRAMTVLTIDTPDDDLFRMLLVKLFLDRQLIVDSSVVDFLVRRIERSFEAARSAVAVLDREGLSRGRRITRALAGELLEEVLAQSNENE
ncbi:chromosomal replication initiator protein DnaA [Labrys miyagiensis]